MTDFDDTQPTPTPSPATAAGTPPLRRRATERVVAGVASGLADYLNVDPLLIRVGLVGLVLFNGAGFLIYLAAWLLIPLEGQGESIVEGWMRRPRGDIATAVVAGVVLLLIATAVVSSVTDEVGGRVGVGPWFGLALIVIAAGVFLFRRPSADGMRTAAAETAGVGTTGDERTARSFAPATATGPARARVRHERSPLGLYVVGLLLLTLGALAAIDVASTDSVLPSTYAGAALLVVGGGLVVGAWWGRARWLIALAVLLVPPAIALGFVRMPLDGTWGTERFAPASASELRDTYEVAGGRLTLDLSELAPLSADRRVAAHVAVGRLLVILPEGARADVTSTVGAGASEVLGWQQEGTALTDRRVSEGDGAPLVLELEVGLGAITVETAGSGE